MVESDFGQSGAQSSGKVFTVQEAIVVETEAGNAEASRLTAALQSLLVEKGLLFPNEVEQEIEKLDAPGVHLGARLVARAWVDERFKERLLADGKSAAAEFGMKIGEAQLIVVENTVREHNLIVCTLCSCYPRSLLGQPPTWYISKSYRARAVREPRDVLSEFGLDVPSDVRVRVHDSNADMRYLVLPLRPLGSEDLDEEALSRLVTRDSLIGAGLALAPPT
ncbi:nitrile hydratase subunit alpha [Beijerinckia sp. L45]|uniref:nitrile hydratase subunit alpha n=1 Tax=Beijerinckia sp. L45 TaxID=1641855 RepID=UPI00131C941B|nr:nitrile hydratase subunit alpha [Beijerinckia sp. L45]